MQIYSKPLKDTINNTKERIVIGKNMAALASLMGAKNKTTVNDLFNHTFRHRDNLNLAPLDTIGSELGIKASEVLPVLEAAREVIKKSLYKASGEVDYNAIVNNCDPSLDDRLKKLIAKVVGMYLLAIIDLRIFLFTNRQYI